LGKLGVDLEGLQAIERLVALEATRELVEDRRGKCDFGGRVEVHDGFEGAAFPGSALCQFTKYKLVQSRCGVLETGQVDDFLRDALMGRLFLLVDALGEMETGPQRPAHQFDDFAGNGGGEHHLLAVHLFGIREMRLDVFDLPGETVVQQTISFVHDESLEVGGLDARV
jgi:hypothetical protein